VDGNYREYMLKGCLSWKRIGGNLEIC